MRSQLAMTAAAVLAPARRLLARARGLVHSRAMARAEAALWLTSCAAGGAFLWWLADAGLYQRRAAVELRELGADAGQRTPAPRLPAGTPIAQLTIPRLDLSAVVAEGVDDGVLRRAVGRIPASARPGDAGNVALAGHRDTFLRPLERIRAGDLVRLETGSALYEYRVEWTAVVDPGRTDLVRETGYPALTLVTCYPFRWVGEAPRRFVVRARRVESDFALGAAG